MQGRNVPSWGGLGRVVRITRVTCNMENRIEEILKARPLPRDDASTGTLLGHSREGRSVLGHRFGRGPLRVSLLAGCHADEPAGPRLLRHLVSFMAGLEPSDPLLDRVEWWIVPQANPDGEHRNLGWQLPEGRESLDDAHDVAAFLRGREREEPGDDMEFGFPRDPSDHGARPENRAILQWWRTADGPFHLHVSLHGMAFAAGPWFLLDPAWVERTEPVRRRLEGAVRDLGYRFHDVERKGEKGFHRIASGFATRPSSDAMRDHFLEKGDESTAGRFRPNSMETIRRLGLEQGADPLTMVTEVPLFLTPGVGRELGPPDPIAVEWSARIAGWQEELAAGTDADRIRRAAAEARLTGVPLRHQLTLQWACIAAGVALLESQAD